MNVHISEPKDPAQACIIWMHGLGADASDMMGLAEQLMVGDLSLRHIGLNAPHRPVTINGGMVMPAWYDIVGMQLTDREDSYGIEQSEQMILQVIKEQRAAGLRADQIFLAGFSQGGAMAIHTALHLKERLAGVIALSAYLPMANEATPQLHTDTPFFMALGQFDPIVLPLWTKQSQDWLLANGYKRIDMHSYPMEHSVCLPEIKDISLWLTKQLEGVVQ